MWKPWKRRARLATGGYVGPGAYVLGDVDVDPHVLPPSAVISPPQRPAPVEVHLHVTGDIGSQAEAVAAIKQAVRRSRGPH